MPTAPSTGPKLRIAGSLWILVNHPSSHDEWSLETKVAAIAGARFEGIQAPWLADLSELLSRHGLAWIGVLDAGNRQNFAAQLARFKRPEVVLVNAQLGDHDTPPDIALELALDIMSAADQQGVPLQIETHRDTATETPEKFATLVEGFKQATGRPLPVTWDHSHFALIKHLHPDDFTTRLITHDELLGRSHLLHCRPFNSHHCQIPVCHQSGQLTPEFLNWLQFMREVFRRWITSPHLTSPTGRALGRAGNRGGTKWLSFVGFPRPMARGTAMRRRIKTPLGRVCCRSINGDWSPQFWPPSSHRRTFETC